MGWVRLGDQNLARLLLLLAPSEQATAKGESHARNEIAP
jgi:hypothetical protein